MAQPGYSNNEVMERATLLYEQRIRALVEAQNQGNFLVIDVETGDYEVDADHMKASNRAAAKNPNAKLVALRIGYPAVGRIGGRMKPTKRSE